MIIGQLQTPIKFKPYSCGKKRRLISYVEGTDGFRNLDDSSYRELLIFGVLATFLRIRAIVAPVSSSPFVPDIQRLKLLHQLLLYLFQASIQTACQTNIYQKLYLDPKMLQSVTSPPL